MKLKSTKKSEPKRSPQAKAKAVRIQRGGIDLPFAVLVLLLLTIGLIMLFSASYANAYYYEGNSFKYITSQLIFAAVGVVAMFAASLVDYHIFHRFAWLIYGLCIVLLVVVLFMPEINNAKRWIILPAGGTFQPSEIAKFAIVILFAHIISHNYNNMKKLKTGILPFAVLYGIVAGLMMMQPHLSGTILIGIIAATLIFVGGADAKWFVTAGIVGVIALIGITLIPGVISYASSRLAYWLDPFSDAKGKGFQTIQSLYAIGSGGLMGVGIGNSRQKYLYLPEPQNDFVFAIVCEELGFIGAALIVVLFALLVWRGFVIAARAKDRFGALIAIGLTTQVGIQAILNIMVVTNTIPNTGISLPFFSYGGTALLMLLGEMGVILSVSRHTSLEKE